MWLWKSDTQFWFLHQFHAISLKLLWDHSVERVLKNILMTCSAGHATSWAVSWAANFQSGVVEGRKSFCLICMKIFSTIYFHIWSEYKPIITRIGAYLNILIKISLIYGRQPINSWRLIMWHSCHGPICPTFLKEFSKFHHCKILLTLLTKRSLINWQIYMESIYWQVMPKVKKKVTNSDRDFIKFVKEMRGWQLRKR